MISGVDEGFPSVFNTCIITVHIGEFTIIWGKTPPIFLPLVLLSLVNVLFNLH